MTTCSFKTFLKALRQKEVGHPSETDCKKMNEKEKAYGPLQIRPAYHHDAEVQFSWADVWHWRKAIKTFICYMHRYAFDDLMRVQLPLDVCEKFARIHNGGPRACLDEKNKSRTDLYWKDVKANILRLIKENGYGEEEEEEEE